MILKPFNQHTPTHKSQQGKGNPVIYAGDEPFHGAAGQPAQQRHAALKEPKMKSQPEGCPHIAPIGRSANAQRNCKGIHGNPNCN